MFGRIPRLPIDITLGVAPQGETAKPYSVFVENLRARLAHAYDLASRGIKRKAEANKLRYDVRAQETSLQLGDRVLVRNLTIRGKRKLQDRWEDTPYQVVRRAGDLQVYWVRKESDHRDRVLHRNLLLPYRLPTADTREARRLGRQDRRQAESGAPSASNDPMDGQQEEEADPPVFVVASGESKNNSDLNAAAPHFLPVQPIGPPDVVDVGPHQHPDVTDSGESEGDMEDPDTASMASDDPAGLHDQISDPEDQAADISPFASGIGAGDPTDSDSQANQPALDRPVVIRSGRATKPPERLVCDPTWCNKATVLLSFSPKSHLA